MEILGYFFILQLVNCIISWVSFLMNLLESFNVLFCMAFYFHDQL